MSKTIATRQASMPEMLSPSSVKPDPKDIVRVIEVTLPQISSWILQCGGLPEYIARLVRDLDVLKKGLAPLYDEMQEGDSLWLCRSDQIGPLYGHEGIALVRDGRPVVYVRIVQH